MPSFGGERQFVINMIKYVKNKNKDNIIVQFKSF